MHFFIRISSHSTGKSQSKIVITGVWHSISGDLCIAKGVQGASLVGQVRLQDRAGVVATIFTWFHVAARLCLHVNGMYAVNRLKSELGVDIRIPSDADHGSIIRIEGSAVGVAKAKAELMELVDKVVSNLHY